MLLAYGGPLPFTASVTLAAALSDLHLGYRVMSAVLVLVAVSALVGTQWLPRRLVAWRSLSLIPQLIVLWLSMSAILVAVAASHFGDGVLRPRAFIFLDQLPGFLLCLFYTAAFFEPAVKVFWREKVSSQ